MKNYFFFIGLLLGVFLLHACQKDKFYTGNSDVLTFEEDTMTFDTVFTTVGTITRYFKVTNTSKQDLIIDEIRIAEGDESPFRINVDGVSAVNSSVKDVTILAEDYIYIFVEATLDANNASNPMIIVNELQYFYNGNEQKSYLRAWGQDAYFHYGEILSNQNVVWNNDKPHVVVRNSNFVGLGVDSFSVLTIPPGTQVYFGAGAAIYVDGELHVGSPGNIDSVTFQSARIEDLPNGLTFDETAGLWNQIGMLSGSRGTFHNVRIKQATYGIAGRNVFGNFQEYGSTPPDITLDRVIIKNTLQSAFFALNSDVQASNCLFYAAGSNLVVLALGGDYQFDNCTFYNSGGEGLSHQSEVLAISNFASNPFGGALNNLENATLNNCIIYGSLTEELLLNQEAQASFNYSFNNCLIRTELDAADNNFNNCILNQDPLFESTNEGLFQLTESSPCIDAGLDNSAVVSSDLEFQPRFVPFDIGAYEYQL